MLLLSNQSEPMNNSLLSNSRVGNQLKSYTFSEAQAFKAESVWHNLATIEVKQAIDAWLETLVALTAKNYSSGMKKLAFLQLIDLNATLQSFALTNHEAVIDQIKGLSNLSECSKQARAACYISFTRFLNRRTQGIISKAVPSREGTSKTFYRVREKVATQAMNRTEWQAFLQELYKLNRRDCLIAKIILQGGKRLGEALSLDTTQIAYAEGEITFHQSKTKGYEKETIITYPQAVLSELRTYIGERHGKVFITATGKPVMANQLALTFAKAGVRAGIPFKVTPHVLRASMVTYLKNAGFADGEIMKVTGHASAEMVYAYDKSARAQNATKHINLV